LRAFTARDRKALDRAAETYRPNPRFDTAEAIRDVGTGEAVTSTLEDKGAPGIVERTLIRPPSSKLGPISTEARRALIAASPIAGKYEATLDRNSASEILSARADQAAKDAEVAEENAEALSTAAREFNAARRYTGAKVSRSSARGPASSDSFAGDVAQAMASVVVKELKGTTGRRLVRGILGGLFRGR
ncbi:MAG: helicase HerA-like domain-containing protein, partial [Pseudomonadota bacterium]